MTRASDSDSNRKSSSIKFLYSYGGRITPRFSDGALRYIGGSTRVVSVDRSISFSDLMVKFVELCGTSMNLKCKLPKEDLDLLISIKSDEDLQNVIEEYDRDAPGVYIRAVLLPIASLKHVSPPCSPLLRPDYNTPPVKYYQLSKLSGLNLHQQPPSKYVVYPPPPSRLRNCSGSGRKDELLREVIYCRRHGNCRQLYPGGGAYPIVANKP